MITTIVFDLDDTLYDEIEYCKSGFRAVADFLANQEQSPSPIILETMLQCFKSGERKKVFNAALEQLSIRYNDELIKKLVEVYRNHIPRIKLPQDSCKVLEELSSNYNLSLLTDGFLPSQKLKVKALGIEKYFSFIIYTEELGRENWKPSPVGFKKIIGTLKTRPEQMAYVADNAKKDFIAPNKLGFTTIQLIRPNAIHKEPPSTPDATAKYVIHSINQLPELLEKIE